MWLFFPLTSLGYASAGLCHLNRQVSIRFSVFGTHEGYYNRPAELTDQLSLADSHRRLVDLYTCHIKVSHFCLFT